MPNIRIMHNNYLAADTITDMTKSSELGAAPATNLYAKVRRTKVFRSRNCFEVRAANNVIIFQETASVDLTATIDVGDFSTDATFFAAVKLALENAGASTYTVARDTTSNKIKITSDGLGGGGIFSLMWTDALSTAADMLGFDDSADDTGSLTYTADLLKIHTSEWVRWDLGTAANPKAFIICGKRNSPIGLSSTAVVKLQGNTTDVWTAPEFEQALDWDEQVISLFDSDGLHTSALRYWRLHIVDTDNPNLYIEIAKAYLGDAVEPEQGKIQFPLDYAYTDYSPSTNSEFGVTFSDIRQQTMTFPTIAWRALTVAETESLMDFVEDVGTHYPFFICLDPSSVFSTGASRWVKFVRFTDAPKFMLTSPGYFLSDWSLREEL